MKQVVLIHGGEAFDSYEEYFEYLRSAEPELEGEKAKQTRWNRDLGEYLGKGFQFSRPAMPCKQNAKYDEWEIWFERHVPLLKDGVILIGHSLGANFLAKYLAKHTLPVSIAQLHLVAGCFGYAGGFALLGSLEHIEKQCEEVFVYQSKDDPLVPFADGEKYRDALPSAEFVTFEDRGHFLGEEFPELIERIRK